MNLNPAYEEHSSSFAAGELQVFVREHRQELETVTNILSEITHRTPAQVESYLETLLSRLMADEGKLLTKQERLRAYQEWVDSHQGMNFPAFVDDSRESIYGEKG